MQLTIIAAIAVAFAGVVFALQNNVPVTVNFLLWRFDSSLAMVLLIALFLGAIIVALLTTPGTLRRQWAAARQQRRIEELEGTCRVQVGRIAELERATPEAGTVNVDARPYVGLRKLIAGEKNPGDAAL